MSLFCNTLVCFFIVVFAVVRSKAFEKVSIEPVLSDAPREMHLQVLPDGELIAHAVLVMDLISYAYDVPANPSSRLNAVPDWTNRDRYDIEAKAVPDAISMGSQDRETQLRVKEMIRRLLADRFGLVMRVDHQRMPAYAMTVSRSGARLQRSAITSKDCIFDTAPEGCHTFVIGFGHPLNGNAVSMDDLAHYIENWTDLPPVNQTNLSGLFTMHTEGWLPMRLPPPPPNGSGYVDFSNLSTISTVLNQLGLELHRQEEVLPVYTIERIRRPDAHQPAAGPYIKSSPCPGRPIHGRVAHTSIVPQSNGAIRFA
jgi:uncharacterized protein (TIGR03435 family)